MCLVSSENQDVVVSFFRNTVVLVFQDRSSSTVLDTICAVPINIEILGDSSFFLKSMISSLVILVVFRTRLFCLHHFDSPWT